MADSDVRVLVAGNDPASRGGLITLLAGESGLAPLKPVPGETELLEALGRRRPDVVVLDGALGGGAGLRACFRIKQRPDPPGVVLCIAREDPVMAVSATIAQADAMVARTEPAETLVTAVWRVAAGRNHMPALAEEAIQAASARFVDGDLELAERLLARAPLDRIAAELGRDPGAVRREALRIIGELEAVRPGAGLG